MEEEYKQIRGNFVEEMQNKIKQYKDLKEKCKQQCIRDCDINFKLEKNDKPSIFTWDRNTKKQEIKRKKCADLFVNSSKIADQCSQAVTSTDATKLKCDEALALYKNIQSLFAMYEQEHNDVYKEELNLKNGMIDIKFQQEDSSIFIRSVPRSDNVIDVKNKFVVGDVEKYDITYNNMRLEDEKTLGNYNIMTGDTLFITLKPIGGSQKRRTIRKNKRRRV
jgi:hypothetical protein